MTFRMTRICGPLLRAGAAAALLPVLTACAGNLAGDDSLPAHRGACAAGAQSEWRPGCDTQRNLAALAEDPDDLHRPRPEGARDGARRDSALSDYLYRRANTLPNAPASPPAAGKGDKP